MKHFSAIAAARMVILGLAALTVAGCASTPNTAPAQDPLQGFNRAMHSFNVGVDRVALRPASKAYGAVVPKTIRHIVGNELRFLALPVSFANSLLQGDLNRAGQTAARFVVNGVVGGLGALDPATEMGIPDNDEDFGQTLAVWGMGPGPYIELPLLGPTTGRGILGRVADMGLDPATYVNAPVAVSAGRRVLNVVDIRHRLGDVADALLYESDDSYITVKNVFLQRRIAAIMNGQISPDQLPDIYQEDPF